VRALQPAARNPLRVTAAVFPEGLQRSDDGGQTWHKVLDLDVYAIVSHPDVPEVKYIAAEGGSVYRSQNEGVIWEELPAGDHPPDVPITALLIAPQDPQRLYLGLEGAGLWSSSDGGHTWQPRARGLPPHVTDVVASPSTLGRLFASAEGMFFRSDPGGSWEQIELPNNPQGVSGSAVALLGGKTEVLLAAAGGGIARSDDQGSTWEQATSEVPFNGAVSVISPASYHIDTAFAGTRGGQVLISTDRGRSWQPVIDGLSAVQTLAAARLV
jgi:photosystem II stability/assembly factor-like uncharacterized protein